MLEELVVANGSFEVFRYASEHNFERTARESVKDDFSASELLEYLGPVIEAYGPQRLLDGPFEPKSQLETPGRFGAGRFSDGTWAVFYSAREIETAQEETKHWIRKRVLRDPAKYRVAYYTAFKATFAGAHVDLRPKAAEWPLTSEDWSFCQELGAEAVASSLDAFMAPSARKRHGTTTPVFQRRALAEPKIINLSLFQMDPSVGSITISELPSPDDTSR